MSTLSRQKDAPIEIVAYRPEWVEDFGVERQRLVDALGPWLTGTVQHIGSTAVPGLAAKPLIDIMAPIRSLEDGAGAIEAARTLGYHHYPYLPDVMHWFCKPSPEVRTHHLHLVPFGSRRWVDTLAFRDALRSDPDLAQAYAGLKRELAARFRTDREGYTQAKASFVDDVISGRTAPLARPG
ncbi:GrpB family protein [Rhizobacter sp. LjRoot28]|uniref:GrpB family protein n=1 Tax=Rhizobacter sp. LjRoot28 TaxID=3342309 RepID=UPI003ECDADF5